MPLILQTHAAHKVELALVNLITSSSLHGQISSSFSASFTHNPLQIVPGKGNDDKNPPVVICQCERGKEDNTHTGLWRIDTTIKVKEVAKDVATNQIGKLADMVYGLILDPNVQLGSYFTDTGSLFVYDMFITNHIPTEIDGKLWVDTLQLDIVVTG